MLYEVCLNPSLLQESERLLRRVMQECYASDSRYRATIFERIDGSEQIQAALRWQEGVVSPIQHPGVSFTRGQLVAGRAWEAPGRFFVLELPEFADRRDLVRYYIDSVGVPEESATRLGSWMERTRGILCIGLHLDPADEPVVLSVDTKVAGGFVEEEGGRMSLRGSERMLPILAEFRESLSLHSLCGQV